MIYSLEGLLPVKFEEMAWRGANGVAGHEGNDQWGRSSSRFWVWVWGEGGIYSFHFIHFKVTSNTG